MMNPPIGPFAGQSYPPSYPPYGTGGTVPAAPQIPPGGGQLPMEQSYVENILRLNLGKMATIYMTFENNSEWNAKVFRGLLEAAGRDHIINSYHANGMRLLLQMDTPDTIHIV